LGDGRRRRQERDGQKRGPSIHGEAPLRAPSSPGCASATSDTVERIRPHPLSVWRRSPARILRWSRFT
jgi:hypothetical protein